MIWLDKFTVEKVYRGPSTIYRVAFGFFCRLVVKAHLTESDDNYIDSQIDKLTNVLLGGFYSISPIRRRFGSLQVLELTKALRLAFEYGLGRMKGHLEGYPAFYSTLDTKPSLKRKAPADAVPGRSGKRRDRAATP